MKSHTITGGGGLALHVDEAGKPGGKPILFIHGISQCTLCWSKQLRSDLAHDFRLVAMDLRGHGESQKPLDVYGEPKLWADDVHAVMQALHLEKPVLVGWSYGGFVICDYVRHYGEDNIAGVNWVGCSSRLGEALGDTGFLNAELFALAPGLFSQDAEASTAALQKFLRMLFHREPSREDRYLVLGYNSVVPAPVRQQMFARNIDNDSLIGSMRRPMRVTFGAEDRIVLPAAGEHIARLARHSSKAVYAQVGHSPFWEDAERFGRELREFRASL